MNQPTKEKQSISQPSTHSIDPINPTIHQVASNAPNTNPSKQIKRSKQSINHADHDQSNPSISVSTKQPNHSNSTDAQTKLIVTMMPGEMFISNIKTNMLRTSHHNLGSATCFRTTGDESNIHHSHLVLQTCGNAKQLNQPAHYCSL